MDQTVDLFFCLYMIFLTDLCFSLSVYLSAKWQGK